MPQAEGRSRNVRQAVNESVHRTMNEQRERDALHDLAVSMRCECECLRAECGDTFDITINDYEAVRTNGHRFIVKPGHEGEDEAIISMTEVYFVIEKRGEQGRIADSLARR